VVGGAGGVAVGIAVGIAVVVAAAGVAAGVAVLVATVRWACAIVSPLLESIRKVEPQSPVAERGALQLPLRLGRRLDIGEINVRKAAGPARGAVDRYPHVLNVVELAEKLVQLGVGRLVRDVADKELAGRLLGGALVVLPLRVRAIAALLVPGNAGNATTVPERAVDVGTRILEFLGAVERNEAVSNPNTQR
jgi:hypothetical protein